ncbi:ScyD/ScyE family protein [Arthrobacter sp. JSM 101049]|uniref:ScyD/ScyE family protein n=1 Tax=Arthrobacter sp. JSM 101049 TaxID=929097 RepID=UPI00356468B5
MRFRTLAASTAAAALAITLTSGPALAHPGHHGHGHGHSSPPTSRVVDVADGLISPLKVAFGLRHSYLVAESMAGMLTRIDANGHRRTLVSAPGKEIAGVSYRGGTTYFTQNDQPANPEEPPSTLLPAKVKTLDSRGHMRTLTDLSTFEERRNPDGRTVYGVRKISKSCLAQAPFLQSRGEVYSHPYSTAPTRHGVYVGDAGANDIVYVSHRGHVQLVRTIPAEPIKIDDSVVAAAADMKMTIPECAKGLTYWMQAVPTDIEVRGNWLYYSVLPGAPGEELGHGKVYRTHLHSGRTQLLASGLQAPTGVAVDERGTVYVSELFGNRISRLGQHRTTTVSTPTMPADIEVSDHRLIAVTEALMPTGKLVKMRVW